MAVDKRWATRGWSVAAKLAYYSDPAAHGCLVFMGPRDESGYGLLWHKGRARRAHRLAWVEKNGAIRRDLYVCHRCDNPACVNADHLFVGTHADNMADKTAKGRAWSAPGEKNPAATLTTDIVLAVRSSKESDLALARKHGVSGFCIWAIRHRQTWAHVE